MEKSAVVYKFTPGIQAPPPPLPEGLALLDWRPSIFRAYPSMLQVDRVGFLKNWVFHFPALLLPKRPAYSVFALIRGDKILSQCIVTPEARRFGFMGKGDVQIGMVHTEPEARGQGLAGCMVDQIIARASRDGRVWWLTEVDNHASRRVAERAGFEFVGNASRSKVAGMPVYRLDP